MLSFECSRPFRVIFVGVLMVCSGTLMTTFWPRIFKVILAEILLLRPGGLNFQMWETPPVPIYMEFYFFNWTNPDDFFIEGTKPHFVEVGPYRFRETKEKKDVVWNSNHTISFKQERVWYFDEENSNGSSTDYVTTLNAVALSAAYVSRNWNFFLQLPLSQILKSEPIAVTRTVIELLFDGYSDKLIDMAALGSLVNMVDLQFDKFAWFYKRNGSEDYEGVYNMATGGDDISNVAKLREWNYMNQTDFYSGSCGDISGGWGERFPPWRTKTESLQIYSKEICRAVDFDYSEEEVVEGITGYRYVAGPKVMDNGTLDPNNECYCGGECVPSGVMNVSACQFNSPGFLSYPHFLDADPYYINLVDGLQPDPAKHTFYVTIEPTTGLPLDVAGRFQTNILVQPYRSLMPFRNLPKIFFPMLWFEERARISPKLALYVKLVLFMLPVGTALSICFLVLGAIIVTLAVMQVYRNSRKVYKGDMRSRNLNSSTIVPLMVVSTKPTHCEESSTRLVTPSRPIYITEHSTKWKQ